VDALTRVGRGRSIFTLLLFLQCFIVLTGGIVRITGSGLGCPTWPECAPGSFTPSPNQEESQLHAWIEFANRLLTFLLGFAALAAVIYSLAFIPIRRIRALAGLQLLGIIAQAILGGITVLTGLHPTTVVAHLLVSIILIAGALSLRQRVHGKSPSGYLPTQLTLRLLKGLVVVGFAVVVMGSIVTGTGPHSGDSESSRFGFDLRTVAWLCRYRHILHRFASCMPSCNSSGREWHNSKRSLEKDPLGHRALSHSRRNWLPPVVYRRTRDPRCAAPYWGGFGVALPLELVHHR